MKASRSFLYSISILALLPLSSCILGSSSKTTQEGRIVSDETLARVHPGSTSSFVRGLLGAPTDIVSVTESKTDKQEAKKTGEIWRYSYSRSTRSSGSVFLVIGASSKSEEKGSVFVEFKDGQVIKTWRD